MNKTTITMGWMKQIYTICKENRFKEEFMIPYDKAKETESKTMMFQGVKITMRQAEGIKNLSETIFKDMNS